MRKIFKMIFLYEDTSLRGACNGLQFGVRASGFGVRDPHRMQGVGVRVQESNLPAGRNNSETIRVLAYGAFSHTYLFPPTPFIRT